MLVNKKIITALIIGIISLFFIFVLNGMTHRDAPLADWYVLYDEGELVVSFETVSTPAEMALGLSGREGLPESTGMIFVFPKVGKHGIWMKGMKFNIDILWLDEKFEVVNIVHSATPDTYPRVFTPNREISYVIEVQAGFAKKYNIKIGELLDIRKEGTQKN